MHRFIIEFNSLCQVKWNVFWTVERPASDSGHHWHQTVSTNNICHTESKRILFNFAYFIVCCIIITDIGSHEITKC
jgi:hypothetical protein